MKYVYLFIFSFILGCTKEHLSSNSVVEANIVQQTTTKLDEYIQREFVQPYGIDIVYRWDGNNSPKGEYTYPAKPEKVQEVLNAIKFLWLETYSLSNVGGKDFLKGKIPLKIYMYGGNNVDANAIELINNTTSSAIEMRLYNVNTFDPKDFAEVFILMRSVHHQFAKRLLQLFPYDRDKFAAISQKKYSNNTQNFPQRKDISANYLRNIDQCEGSNLDEYIYIVKSDTDFTNIKRGYFSTGKRVPVVKVERRYCSVVQDDDFVFTEGYYAHQEGFLTLHAMLSPEDDFAEIISATLTHTKAEIDQAMEIAHTPLQNSDPKLQQQHNRNAEEAYNAINKKKTFVYDYFKKEIGINIERMQTISIQRIKSFVNQ